MANGMWTRMGASGTSVIIAPKVISKEIEERMRICIEQYMKKAKPEDARSLKLVRLHVEKALSLSLTHHKDVLKRLMHGALQRGIRNSNQPTEPVRPEITIAKTNPIWWKQEERHQTMLMGLNRLFQFAIKHTSCNLDVIETMCNLLPIVTNPELNQILQVYSRQLGSLYIGHDELPDWIPGSAPSPIQVLDTITSMHIYEQVGLQHSRAHELRAFLLSKPYTPQDYFGWDPSTACPSNDHNQTGFQKLSNALTALWYASSLDLDLGCPYHAVLKWLPAYYPYQAPSALTELEYIDQCYLVCRSIMTLTNWGTLQIAVDLMPNEYYFLLAHIDIHIGRGDVHLIGEFTRALKCFGTSVDRGIAFALCYPHSFVQEDATEVPEEIVHKASVVLYSLSEPCFIGYAPAITDPQVLAQLQRNASTEHLRKIDNAEVFDSDLKRNIMKQSLRKVIEKSAVMDVKLAPAVDPALQKILNVLESSADVKTLDERLALRMLQELNAMTLSVETMKNTGVGRSVNKLRKHPVDEVSRASQALVAKWKKELLG